METGAGLTPEQAKQWDEDGFFILKGFADRALCAALTAEAISEIRADPPAAHPGERAYRTPNGLYVQPESQPMPSARAPDDLVAKTFNPHLAGQAKDFALSGGCADIVCGLLGPDVDVFQSMFILKNPGTWGQPWHQDSLYFNFDQQPQVGLWLALTEATRENGCLLVLPGSHKRPVLPHSADRRPGANQGYLEIPGLDDAEASPVLMAPGDLLVFHSYLIHRSADNQGAGRRAAMVYHYGRAGSRNLADEKTRKIQDLVTRWTPVRRAAA